jgi:S1-C subfamily serine protease
MRLADEGRQIAYTAFDALAVTEKMTKDAFWLDRRLKVGLAVVFGFVVVMAGIYLLFARSAQRETQRANAIIAKLEAGLNQQSLVDQVRKLREEGGATNPVDSEALRKQAEDLRARIADANAENMAALQKELQDTNTRLEKVEQGGSAAQNLIPSAVQSVCLLHVSVALRHLRSGRRVRYVGIDRLGEPLRDTRGNPLIATDGRGPEVRLDIFGTGFLAGHDGLVITNRHVAEPWWKNQGLNELESQGLQAEISTIRAYFPGDPHAFATEIKEVSTATDLATMRVKLQGFNPMILPIDPSQSAVASGKSIVSMGYATGLAGILARADEETAQDIITDNNGQVSRILDELAQRGLIRPIVTQGHVGDVMAERIIFDAQTTSGGSGGPLFNEEGKVVAVTYAVLQGFGGSNFGIPIRFSQPLLGQ